MNKSLCQQLEIELNTIIQQHMTTLAEFVTPIGSPDITICKTIQHDLSILDELCQLPCATTDRDTYSIVRESLGRIRQLLQLLNLSPDSSTFQSGELGKLWNRAYQWCERFSTSYELTCEEVWALIAPVVPDVLRQLGTNIYEAIWWKSAPRMDIEILQRTEYIQVEDAAFAVNNIPGRVVVRFTIHR
jgi:hypothetical protein